MNNTDKVSTNFAAIDRYVETHIASSTEVKMNGYDWIGWGEDNDFPDYLRELVKNVPTLHSIVEGFVDYASGNECYLKVETPADNNAMNRSGQTFREFAIESFRSWAIYKCMAWEIIRSQDGSRIAEMNVLDPRFLRTDKDCTKFYYSEKWGDKYSRKSKAILYPKWMPDGKHERSILFIKTDFDQTYPSPIYEAAIPACETEKRVNDYHLNAIANGFSASYLISFNNGEPTDEQKKEIVKGIKEKFTGSENAGSLMVTFNESKAHDISVAKLEVDDWGEKYHSLEQHSRSQIFSAFRANPNLFGLPTENLGFSNEEYEQSFKLFNRTMIRPVQKLFCEAIDKLYGMEGVVTIIPFTLE